MSRKWNQYRAKQIRSYGKVDEERLIEDKHYLTKKHGLICKKEIYLFFNRDDGRLVRIQETATEEEVSDTRFKILWTDLVIMTAEGRVICAIEDDGVIHWLKQNNTSKRNEYYHNAKIPLIIIDRDETKILQETQITCWKERLDSSLRTNNLIK